MGTSVSVRVEPNREPICGECGGTRWVDGWHQRVVRRSRTCCGWRRRTACRTTSLLSVARRGVTTRRAVDDGVPCDRWSRASYVALERAGGWW
eukprot:7389013-Prymnesium_polylepis.3